MIKTVQQQWRTVPIETVEDAVLRAVAKGKRSNAEIVASAMRCLQDEAKLHDIHTRAHRLIRNGQVIASVQDTRVRINELLKQLTDAQRAVLRYVTQGHTQREVSVILSISQPTVNEHMRRIREVAGDVLDPEAQHIRKSRRYKSQEDVRYGNPYAYVDSITEDARYATMRGPDQYAKNGATEIVSLEGFPRDAILRSREWLQGWDAKWQRR